MGDENERIRARIRKLLNLADNAGAQGGEIDNALRFARRLMVEHGIDEADARADSEGSTPEEIAAKAESTIYSREIAYMTGQKASTWEGSLAMALCDMIGSVKCYFNGVADVRTSHGTIAFDPDTGEPMRRYGMMFYGPAEDVEAAKAMFSEWGATIAAMARMKYGGALRGPGRSYCEGFTSEIRRKVNTLREEERAQVYRIETGSVPDADRPYALALKRNVDLAAIQRDRAKSWLKSEHGVSLRPRSGGGGGSHDSGAYGAGRSDGRRSSLGSYSRRPKLTG